MTSHLATYLMPATSLVSRCLHGACTCRPEVSTEPCQPQLSALIISEEWRPCNGIESRSEREVSGAVVHLIENLRQIILGGTSDESFQYSTKQYPFLQDEVPGITGQLLLSCILVVLLAIWRISIAKAINHIFIPWVV